MKTDDTIRASRDLSVRSSDLRVLARRYHIRRAALFGSAARGERQPGSLIDLLIEFEPDAAPSFWSAPELEDAFSSLFGGRAIDIVPHEVLRNPYRRRTIERDIKVRLDESA